MKYCANCGKPIDEDAAFCGECGLSTAAPSGNSRQNQNRQQGQGERTAPILEEPRENLVTPIPERNKKSGRTTAIIVSVAALICIAFAVGFIGAVIFNKDNDSNVDVAVNVKGTAKTSNSAVSSDELAEKDYSARLNMEEELPSGETSSDGGNNTIAEEGYQEGDEYLFPSDTEYITVEYLATLTKGEIGLIRNEIYARHGYIFQTEEYTNYFKTKSWYIPNPNFDASMLNEIEVRNKDVIVAYEKQMGWR